MFLLNAGDHCGELHPVDAVGDEHLHCEPGGGRHPGHALLRAAVHHLGRHQHLDLRVAHVQDSHIHTGETLVYLQIMRAGIETH